MHPEILKTERLGSRDKGNVRMCCQACGKADSNGFFVGATGKVFCSEECIQNIFRRRQTNDKKGVSTAILLK